MKPLSSAMAASGHAATALQKTAIKSRRLIASLRRSRLAIVTAEIVLREEGSRCPPGVRSRHMQCETRCSICPASGYSAFQSITSSAKASKVGGKLKPRALAALSLTTNWNVMGCSIGRLDGFPPLRICRHRWPPAGSVCNNSRHRTSDRRTRQKFSPDRSPVTSGVRTSATIDTGKPRVLSWVSVLWNLKG